MTYRMNEQAEAIIRTPVGETSEFTIRKIIKQGKSYGPVICCTKTATVNDNTKCEHKYHYEKVRIAGPVFMDNIMAAGQPKHIELKSGEKWK